MPIPKTKLRPPTLRQPMVPRPRLTISFIDRRPLTLVSAPAGSGKTTLALEWLASSKGKIAWLSLDLDDNDPIRFINGVVSALHVAGIKFRVPSGQRNPKTIVTEIINQLADADMESITFVLDDYHRITEESIHSTLTYLIDHIPTSLQLVLVTREEPPLPIARYRARGQLCEFHASDLRFTPDETKLFLNEVMGLNLSAEQLYSLERYTQGWAAGLQMAGISIQTNQNQSLSNANERQFIAEYMLTEVFNHQSKETQGFLLNTSILERFSATLCKVIYSGNANKMLAHIERSNLFITRVDSSYQYHPLFREFLHTQLQTKFPDRVTTLHHKVCEWLEQNGFLAEAIPHAFANSDNETAARLIAALAPDTFKRGELVTLRRWLDRLPESVIWNHPRLCLTQIWLLLDSNRQNEAQTYFDRLGSFLEQNLRGEFLAVRALHAAMTHQPELALKFAQQAQKTTEAKDPFIQTYVSFGLGAAQKMGLHFFQAEQSFREALALAEAAENSYIAVASIANLVDVLYLQARLTDAEKLCKDALHQYQENTPYLSDWYWTLARIAHQRNKLDDALTFINRSIDLCADTEEAGFHVLALVERAQIQYAKGDKNLAQTDLDSADQLARVLQEKTYLRSVVRQRVLFAADNGDITSARQWLKALAEYSDKPFPFYSAFAEGKVLLAEKKYRQAKSSFEMALRYLDEVDFALFRIEVLVWQAVCLEGLGYMADATQALTHAIKLGRTGDVIHPFVAAREGLLKLIRYLGRGESAWVSDHIYRDGMQAKFPARSESEDPDLTRREKEILNLIEMGMSNREMAEKLVIAEGTLKRHVANLYQKLGVHNRAQAIKQFYRQ
ncbi:MAG TPA: LuxR C-terminal-related transcriptional regulator [Anaerolineales bacterium]|nr:LuxR C-terminal-related transcriptional regulator [Anaerolineales bacterium]